MLLSLLSEINHYCTDLKKQKKLNKISTPTSFFDGLHTNDFNVSSPKFLLWSHAAGLQYAFNSDEWRADRLHGTKMVHTGLTRE